jgi:hypothetical protein
MKILPRKLRGILHPNGFTIRLLAMWSNGMRLRFHTWNAEDSTTDSPHDHRSWFISIPLWGRFVERRYQEVAGDDRQVLVCHATSSGNGNPLTSPAGTGSVKEVSKTTRYPLIPYYCSVDTIHSYVPAKQGFAASLVLFGPNKKTPKVWL